MRYYSYKLTNEMCATIIEAVSYIKNGGSPEMWKGCIEALSSVQSNVETNRDSLKSENIFLSIREIIGEISAVLGGNGNIDKVSHLAHKLSEQCRNDITYKLKVLFVAELGGKWDSMDSVYREFIKRDDCDVDVVIEPIFRAVKLEDSSTRTDVVYNDFLTPMGIKNIAYENYDMEKIRPDLCFFSQPYESVTVPQFYPQNMAKYSQIVFLPYYAAQTLNKKISTALDIFFKSATERYSWRIACQSEIMKKYYGIYASNKGRNVIATGIPKWDYPFSFSKENVACPEQWKEKLSGKKVFLWNTHFSIDRFGSNILVNGNSFLDIFSNSDDKALIWRPHPMTESVLKVHCPEKYPIYKKLIERVEKSKNMVIDTNPGYEQSFVYSDALISDMCSSFIDQYLVTGKPILTLCKEKLEEAHDNYYTIDKLFNYLLLPISDSIKSTKKFIEKVCQGKDPWKEDREKLLREYYPLADGKAGKRVCDKVMEDFYTQFGLEQKIDKTELKNTALIIGTEKDSEACIKQLEEKGVDYQICCGLMPNGKYNENVKTFPIDKLKNNSFEYIIVTEKNYPSTVINILTDYYKINGENILPFWNMYNASLPAMVCDRVLKNPNVKEYEGLIIGISHTEVGIIANKLKAPFCNLAVSSQDLYYQLKTLEYCAQNYADKLKNLKYAIVDLYDCKYLNYDASVSKSGFKYLSYGGYNKDPHNFSDNKNYDYTFDEMNSIIAAQRFAGLSDKNIEIWNKLFTNVYPKADYEGFCGNFDVRNRLKTVSESDIEYYKYNSGASRNVFRKTINENIDSLTKIFETLRAINKDIKIYTVIIPKYIDTEVLQTEFTSKFVDEFNDVIAKLKTKYDFTMLDFNKCSDISSMKSYYYDAAHLNYFGASYLTEELNKIIFND